MKIQHISYSFVLYLALIEGLSLLVMDEGMSPFLIGFIPALVVSCLYSLIHKKIPIKINNKPLLNISFLFSVFNGVFIVILFSVQKFMPLLSSSLYQAIYGFASVLIAVFLMILLFNIFSKRKISYSFSLYAGLFEFFILPLMFLFYSLQWNVFVNGFVAGLIGGAIALFIANRLLKKNPLTLF